MRKIYIIGTVHNMMPKYEEELRSILEGINPDQILVEIVEEDLKSRKLGKYPKEMVFAYKWGIRHERKVDGFDSAVEIVKKSITRKKLKEVEKEAFRIIDRYGWKEMNKSKYDYIEKLEE